MDVLKINDDDDDDDELIIIINGPKHQVQNSSECLKGAFYRGGSRILERGVQN